MGVEEILEILLDWLKKCMNNVTIIGAGLAGCEAALQLSAKGYNVKLYDSKPEKVLPVYNLQTYAELVCNNSIGSTDICSPLGLLLYELELLGSKMLDIAQQCRVEDSSFIAVDKKKFSTTVTNMLRSYGVTIINEHMRQIPKDDHVVIATGPLTDKVFIAELVKKCNICEYHFSDASSPVVDIETVDLSNKSIVKISNDLYAILLSDIDLAVFCQKLVNAESLTRNVIDKTIDFEKCQSIEMLAQLGIERLIQSRLMYKCINQPCILLRRENGLHNGFILVGCMTTLSHGEQKEIFSILPGLECVKFIKYGRMHRNTFLHSPGVLDCFYQVKDANIYIIGQLSGIDGYAPSIASGLVAAKKIIYGNSLPIIPTNTMVGALANYVSNPDVIDFQPMCASFSLLQKTDLTNHAVNSKKLLKNIFNHF